MVGVEAPAALGPELAMRILARIRRTLTHSSSQSAIDPPEDDSRWTYLDPTPAVKEYNRLQWWPGRCSWSGRTCQKEFANAAAVEGRAAACETDDASEAVSVGDELLP